jgi:hypothetical protein
MPNTISVDDLLDFLNHASERGLMPAATAQSLAVASRNVFGILSEGERSALAASDLDGIIKRFTNKRAKEFTPSSLKEYGHRVHRAVELYTRWRESPADFTVKTRATNTGRKRERSARTEQAATAGQDDDDVPRSSTHGNAGYQSAFPIRPGHVVTIANIPYDLSGAEADRLAQFIKILAPASLLP